MTTNINSVCSMTVRCVYVVRFCFCLCFCLFDIVFLFCLFDVVERPFEVVARVLIDRWIDGLIE